ncbi:hypothetical protein DY000_02055600 [Brassica cretica]|uniref:Uncharacterized protein n=1 Tax=Brassica cretica TaxID=69181 RepID=A0ABQ7A6T9_BRACR|nr:hypothetical protein DY000_02055600 [Brassica cretica]
MAHSKVLNSACRGDKTWLLANEPNIVLPSSFSITSPPPKRASSSFQNASNLHKGLWGGPTGNSSMSLFSLSSATSGMICANLQLDASEVADCITSNGESSLSLNTFSLRGGNRSCYRWKDSGIRPDKRVVALDFKSEKPLDIQIAYDSRFHHPVHNVDRFVRGGSAGQQGNYRPVHNSTRPAT